MQAYHPNGDPAYYNQQLQYAQPQTAYYTQYAPYPQYLPPQPDTAQYGAYNPVTYDPQAQQQHPADPPRSRRRKLSRSAASAPVVGAAPSRAPSVKSPGTPGAPSVPLKSALKRTPGLDRVESNTSGVSRHRSEESQRMRVNSLTRARSNTQPVFIPEHLFLSFHSSSELHLDSIAYQSTLDTLREQILPAWPANTAMDIYNDEKWRVRFDGRPWKSAGTDLLIAQRLLVRLWLVLANEGYSYLTTINNANMSKAPRFVFTESPRDTTAAFFSISFSRSTEKVTLLDVPDMMSQDLAASLRAMYPRRIASYGATEDGIHVIEVKRVGLGTGVDRSVFIAYVLRFFKSVGFHLNGSVPFGRRNALGLGARKEVWIFRGSLRRPESRQKQ